MDLVGSQAEWVFLYVNAAWGLCKDLHVSGSVLPTPAVMVSVHGPIRSYRVLQSFGTAHTAVCDCVVECSAAICFNKVPCNAAVCGDKEPGRRFHRSWIPDPTSDPGPLLRLLPGYDGSRW